MSLHDLLTADHQRLDALLDGALDDPRRYDEFRRGLLRHIAIEEKIVLPEIRRRRGSSPLLEQIHLDHAALASLLVPPPSMTEIDTIRSILAHHNHLEEDEGGLYAIFDELAADDLDALLQRVRDMPQVPLSPPADTPVVRRSIEQNLRAAAEARIRMRAAMNIQPISVAPYGIGPIGAEIARLLLTKPWIKVTGAVDIDPNKIGKDLGEVIGLGRETGVRVTRELEGKPDVVCHSTGSRLAEVAGQLRSLLERGCHVVSTCEELSFPLDREIRESLQQIAHRNNVALLGTGVNPGFVMDKLPLTITSVCQDVKSVEIIRIQNASTRREPLQRKVGAGMSVDEFRAAVAAGKIKHMGLKESLMMVGNGLGVDFESVTDEVIDPIVAQREIVTQYLKVAPGQVAGVHQTIHGKGRIDVSLELRMYVGAEDIAADRVIVHGTPDVELEIKGGVHGDRATAAMVVNSIPRIVQARHGVLTMDDIAISYR